MRYIIMVFIIIVSITITGAAPYPEVDPLLKFTDIADEEQLEINSWEVVIKETKQLSNRETFVNKFRNKHLITMTENENSINYVFEETMKNNFKIQYNLVLPYSSSDKIELITVIKGTTWNEYIKESYIETIQHLNKEMFTSNARIFTCLEVIEDDTIEDSMTIESFLSSLELEHMKVQEDNVQSSRLKNIIYGYTHLWKEKFTLNGIPINLQIVVTELDTGELAYKIGTPILINEY